MVMKVELILEVVDFERYLTSKGITPAEWETQWYTFVLTEVSLDEIVYGILARWISMYTNDSVETIMNDLKERTFKGVKVIGADTE